MHAVLKIAVTLVIASFSASAFASKSSTQSSQNVALASSSVMSRAQSDLQVRRLKQMFKTQKITAEQYMNAVSEISDSSSR
jgi:hypothetical protein